MDAKKILNYDNFSLEKRCFLLYKCLREKENLDIEEIDEYVNIIFDNCYEYGELFKLIATILRAYEYIHINKSTKTKKRELANETAKNYNEILDNCIKLSFDLGLNNALEMSIMYTYLLWNGYLSKDNEYYFKTSDRLLLSGYYALDIMNGYGVCLNNASMLTDLLNRNNMQAATISNKCKNIKLNYKVEEIKRNKLKEDLKVLLLSCFGYPLINLITNYSGNHANTLIHDENKLYIYDPTNICLLNIDNEKKASIVCGQGSIDLKPKFSYNSSSLFQCNVIDELYKNNSFVGYEDNEFKEILEETINTCCNNLELLKDFRCEIEDYISNISNEVNLIKQRRKEEKQK